MDDAIKALDASLFDLIVIVLDRLTAPHLRLIQHLSHNVTATPVTVLIKSVEQERFHQIVSDVDIDWTLVNSYDHVSDLTLTRAIQRSITRSEQSWERSHMQRAFKSSLLQYRSLFDEVPDVIFICDRSGCLLDVNDTVARVFGLPKQELLLRPVFEVFGMDETLFDRLLEGAINRSGPVEDIEVCYQPPGGTVVHGLTHMIHLRHDSALGFVFCHVV